MSPKAIAPTNNYYVMPSADLTTVETQVLKEGIQTLSQLIPGASDMDQRLRMAKQFTMLCDELQSRGEQIVLPDFLLKRNASNPSRSKKGSFIFIERNVARIKAKLGLKGIKAKSEPRLMQQIQRQVKMNAPSPINTQDQLSEFFEDYVDFLNEDVLVVSEFNIDDDFGAHDANDNLIDFDLKDFVIWGFEDKPQPRKEGAESIDLSDLDMENVKAVSVAKAQSRAKQIAQQRALAKKAAAQQPQLKAKAKTASEVPATPRKETPQEKIARLKAQLADMERSKRLKTAAPSPAAKPPASSSSTKTTTKPRPKAQSGNDDWMDSTF